MFIYFVFKDNSNLYELKFKLITGETKNPKKKFYTSPNHLYFLLIKHFIVVVAKYLNIKYFRITFPHSVKDIYVGSDL